MDAKDDVVFVYSTQQIEEDTVINRNIGRAFIPGNVSVGNDRLKYSKIVLKDDLNKMVSQYPDTKIVTSGKLGDFKYTKINNDYIK